MRGRLARAAAAALLVLVVAVTPLSAVLAERYEFEVWLPGWQGVAPTHVILEDHTQLVRAISPGQADFIDDGVSAYGNSRLALLVQWLGGCDDPLTILSFDRIDAGYRLTERTNHRCRFLVGIGRAVIVSLWSPIDAGQVEFRSSD
jgi:hypothetical protein